jgi:hypothetical protein
MRHFDRESKTWTARGGQPIRQLGAALSGCTHAHARHECSVHECRVRSRRAQQATMSVLAHVPLVSTPAPCSLREPEGASSRCVFANPH